MILYELGDEDRAALAPHHRAVQAAIAVLANRKLGIEAPVEGIGKWEGGVRVNGREIAIHRDNVKDNWRRGYEPTREESAVVTAIAEVVALVRKEGAAALAAFGTPEHGDPLRSMLGFLSWDVDEELAGMPGRAMD